MPLPFTFGTTPGGTNRPGSDLDTMFQTVGLLGIIPCAASGTNAITLTAAPNTPTIGAYQNNLSLGFVAAGTSSGAVTLAALGLPQLPVYMQDGVTQANAGTIVSGVFYIVSYVSAYNSGGGGWSLTGLQPAASPDFSLLTTTDNPADSAFVAGTIGGGSGNNRKFRVGEIGGWCALDEKVAAGSASLDFNFSTLVADFEDFEFIGSYLAPGTDAVDCWARTSADGTTFDSGVSDYGWISTNQVPAGISASNNATDAQMRINATAALGFSTHEDLCFRFTLFNAGQTATFTRMNWTYGLQTSAPVMGDGFGSGRRLSAAAVKGLQFLPSSGVWATGKVSMLGRRKVT